MIPSLIIIMGFPGPSIAVFLLLHKRGSVTLHPDCAAGGEPPRPYCAAALSNRAKVGWMQSARTAPWPLPGDGLSHPEQEAGQRIPTGDRNGRPDTGPSACSSFCRSGDNQPWFCCLARQRNMPAEALRLDMEWGTGCILGETKGNTPRKQRRNCHEQEDPDRHRKPPDPG